MKWGYVRLLHLTTTKQKPELNFITVDEKLVFLICCFFFIAETVMWISHRDLKVYHKTAIVCQFLHHIFGPFLKILGEIHMKLLNNCIGIFMFGLSVIKKWTWKIQWNCRRMFKRIELFFFPMNDMYFSIKRARLQSHPQIILIFKHFFLKSRLWIWTVC